MVTYGYSGRNPIICISCYFEKILQQILLEGKASDQILIFPKNSLTYKQGQVLVRKAKDLGNKAQSFMTGSKDPDQRITFDLKQYSISEQLSKVDYENLSSEDIIGLLTYKLSEKRRESYLNSLRNAFKKEFGELKRVNKLYQQEYKSWVEFTEDVYYKKITDKLISLIRTDILNLSKQFEVICETANMIIIPCRNIYDSELSSFSNGNESASELGFKKLFISLLFSIGFKSAVTILEDSEVIDGSILDTQGSVHLPNIPGVREVVNNQWLPESQLIKWSKGLASVFNIIKRTEYSSKNDTYKILTANSVGQLAKRIDRKDNFLGPEEIKSLNNIANLLKVAFPELDDQLKEVVACFSDYLDKHVSKSRTNNPYAILGPIKNLFKMIRNKTVEKEELMDYILVLHQKTNKFGSNLPIASKESLEEGIEKILELITSLSYQEKLRLLQDIEDGLYYQRRVKSIESFNLKK